MKTQTRKEEIAEDYCFICKDGGLLLVCDYKNCLKAYHPSCVDKDESCLDTNERWTCDWHSCHICKKSVTYQCFCCPTSFCRNCIGNARFGSAKTKTKGFCNNCLKLALLIEENLDVDSDGDQVDFYDKETSEFLFKEYWDIIKEREGLTIDNLRAADAHLRSSDNYTEQQDSFKLSEDKLFSPDVEEEEEEDDNDDDVEDKYGGNIWNLDPKENQSRVNRKLTPSKPKRKRFISWCSENLMEFLSSIGEITERPLTQLDVSEIVKKYIKEKNLAHSDKRKRRIVCDAKLHALFRRKSIYTYKIYPLLGVHLAENKESDDELYLSATDDIVPNKRQIKQESCSGSQKSSPKFSIQDALQPCRSIYASMIGKNVRSVYLRRSLVLELIKNLETFESKVIGCFVRVKSDPKDLQYLPEKVYQLGQVLAIKKTEEKYKIGEASTDIVLQVSNLPKDIQLFLLSDDDFEEEECHDLQNLVKKGLMKRITTEDLERKVKIVHEDIVNHWINKEISRLQKQIDLANVKGWRKELFEYMERRNLLRTPDERTRLLKEIPLVIADTGEDAIFSPNDEENKKALYDPPSKEASANVSPLVISDAED